MEAIARESIGIGIEFIATGREVIETNAREISFLQSLVDTFEVFINIVTFSGESAD